MNVTILIVEDRSAVRLTLRQWLLASLPGCSVREAGNGADALALVQEEAPALVLMDLHLPGMSGLDATRAILAAAPATQVVVVSVEDTPAHRSAAADAGAAAYVAKGSMGFELLPVLQHLLAVPRRVPVASA